MLPRCYSKGSKIINYFLNHVLIPQINVVITHIKRASVYNKWKPSQKISQNKIQRSMNCEEPSPRGYMCSTAPASMIQNMSWNRGKRL